MVAEHIDQLLCGLRVYAPATRLELLVHIVEFVLGLVEFGNRVDGNVVAAHERFHGTAF